MSEEKALKVTHDARASSFKALSQISYGQWIELDLHIAREGPFGRC